MEVIGADTEANKITTGNFKIQRELTLIDLSKLPVVSIFEKQHARYFLAMKFLQRFIEDISKPVSEDFSKHIHYVPTQVITEYFRYILPTQVKMGIDGIKYKSIKRPGHICYVLFLDERQATQDDADYDCTPPYALNWTHYRNKV